MSIKRNVSFVKGFDLTTTEGIIYEVGSQYNRIAITSAFVKNYSASPVNFTASLIQDGGGALADKHKVILDKNIDGLGDYDVKELVGLVAEYSENAGEGAIYAKASANSALGFSLSGMTATEKNSSGVAFGIPVVKAVQIGASIQTVYAPPAGKNLKISKAFVVNINPAARTIKIWLTTGEAQPDTQYIIQDLTIAANSVVHLPVLKNRSVNYKIHGQASHTNSLYFSVFGTEHNND